MWGTGPSSRYDFTSTTDTSSWPARTIGSCTGGAATTSAGGVAGVHADNGHVAGRDDRQAGVRVFRRSALEKPSQEDGRENGGRGDGAEP